MNFGLNEDHIMVRDMVRRFAADQVKAGAHAWSTQGRLSTDVARKLADNGLLGVSADIDHGGSGLDALSLRITIDELASADAATAVAVAAQNVFIVARGGDAEGACSGAFLPAWGPVAIGHTTPFVASKVDETWTISGTGLVANPFGADHAVVVASYNDTSVALSVELEESLASSTIGLRGLGITELSLTERPAVLLSTIESGALAEIDALFAAAALGIADAAMREAVAYASERVQFGKPLTRFQATQFKLADMATGIDGARLLLWDTVTDPSVTLRYASRVCNAVVDEALQLHGGYGYTDEYPIERQYRDAKMLLPFTRQ